jgi:hypothetical protein
MAGQSSYLLELIHHASLKRIEDVAMVMMDDE